jgi:hypothetical protein
VPQLDLDKLKQFVVILIGKSNTVLTFFDAVFTKGEANADFMKFLAQDLPNVAKFEAEAHRAIKFILALEGLGATPEQAGELVATLHAMESAGPA